MADENRQAVIDIDIREGDGVYLIIDNPEFGPRATRREVLDVIEQNGVQDVDFVMITAIFKRDDLHIEECVSRNTDIPKNPEKATIKISKDKMSASVSFAAPSGRGERLTADALGAAIEREGVRFGIPEGLVERLLKNHEYGVEYDLAAGHPPQAGKDGYLEYHFDEKKKNIRPKQTEDGKVDYKDLDLIEKAEKGQSLVTIIRPVPGVDGINVLAQAVPARQPKQAAPVSAGKNVMQSEDGSELIATEDGQILMDGKKITISPVLEIAGNVDNSTGNIDFNGSIIIRGNVLTGFTVSSVGNIEVMGVVEGAKVVSEHSIILHSGIQGNGVGEISAGEGITSKFVENSTLKSGGDIVSDSIMHSTVSCGGNLLLSGRNALLVGGRVRVAGRVEAQTIGSPMSTATEIEVGLDLDRLSEYREVQAEYDKTKVDFERLSAVVMTLSQAMKKGILPVDKKVLLLKSINQRGALRDKLEEIQERIKSILPHLDGEGDVVIVRKLMHTGVKLLIGNAAMIVQSPVPRGKLVNREGKVQVVPL